jgi:DNA polymerase-1
VAPFYIMNPREHKAILVTNNKELTQLLERFEQEPEIVVDTETDGVTPYLGSRMIGMSVYFPGCNEGYYIAWRHGGVEHRPKSKKRYSVDEHGNMPIWTINQFVDAFRYKDVVMFNAMFDLAILEHDGFSFEGSAVRDVLLAARLYNENEHIWNSYRPDEDHKFVWSKAGAFRLKRLAKVYLGEWTTAGEHELEEAAANKGIEAKGEMWQLSADEVAKYAIFDVVLTYMLEQFYMPKLHRWNVHKLYEFQNEFMLEFWYRAQKNGVRTDRELLTKMEKEIRARVEEHETYFKEIAKQHNIVPEDDEDDEEFNPASSSQMLKLFTAMGYEMESTGKFARLEFVRAGDAFMQRYEDYQEVRKEWTSYYTTYLDLLTEQNKLHPGWFQYGTVSGRPTCSRPNLLQISKKGDIKKVLLPEEGRVLVSIDYAQVELRVAAHFAQQRDMIKLINEGADLHQYTADRLTEQLGFEVSRQWGKTLNFGLIYGMGFNKFAEQNSIDPELAKQLVNGWRETYPEMRGALFAVKALAEKWRTPEDDETAAFKGRQWIRIPVSGRVRRFDDPIRVQTLRRHYEAWDVLPGEKYKQYGYEKTAKEPMVLEPWDSYYSAWNVIVQGTAWALLEQALIKIVRKYDNDTVKPLLAVYDSFVFSTPPSMLNLVVPDIMRIMENHTDFRVPITADVEIGLNYKEMVEVEPGQRPFDVYKELINVR